MTNKTISNSKQEFDKKVLKATKILKAAHTKILARKPLTKLQNEVSVLRNSYSEHFAAKEAVKRGIIK